MNLLPRHRRAALAALALLGVAGCAATPAVPEHPLIGRIWDVHIGRFVDEAALQSRLAAAPLRMLGEIHDNTEHHTLRAAWIARIAATGARPAVVFEQFDQDHDAALATARTAGGDAEALADAGRFNRKGWNWPIYKPLVDAALAAGLPVVAGNLSSADARRIARGGLDPGKDALIAATMAQSDWSDARESRLRSGIIQGHCNLLPESAVPRMAESQRARDAVIATRVADAAATHGSAILIAGNGHVRRDLGVPAYLPAALREAAITVGVVEVRTGEPDAATYGRNAAGEPVFDFIRFTARRERPDPCEGLEKRLPKPPPASASST
jgi:uncharacterized iron-regulated protein